MKHLRTLQSHTTYHVTVWIVLAAAWALAAALSPGQ